LWFEFVDSPIGNENGGEFMSFGDDDDDELVVLMTVVVVLVIREVS